MLRKFRESTGLAVQMRIGVHVGDVVHGVVGSESPRFCASEGQSVMTGTRATCHPGICAAPSPPSQASWARP